MPFAGFSASTLRCLAELSQNSDQAWFDAHATERESLLIEPAKAFVETMGARLRTLDPKVQAIPRVRGSIHALSRRRRFPRRDTKPFRESLDFWFWSGRRRAWDNSGFFLRLASTDFVLAVGMIEFQKETLARYREQVLDEERGALLSAIVHELRANGYVVGGESYKRTPRGVPSDHPRAGLLKHGGVFATLSAEHPKEIETPAFVDFAFGHFARMATLHRWLVGLHGK
jgi:uncharacterized protein (TIGR02453 family)